MQTEPKRVSANELGGASDDKEKVKNILTLILSSLLFIHMHSSSSSSRHHQALSERSKQLTKQPDGAGGAAGSTRGQMECCSSCSKRACVESITIFEIN